MLSERRADHMVKHDLSYANCRFEDLLPEHFMTLMMVTEDIMLKSEASKDANLGSPDSKGQYQGHPHGRDLHVPNGNGTKWQRREQTREVRTNATVANAGGIEELQACIGTYQNATKFFTQKNKVWCAPVREFATGMCTNCSTQHYIDTLCHGGDMFQTVPSTERHSQCPANMAKDMEAKTFKRLTFRFQGGTGGLPKATSAKEAVAAATKVTVAMGSAKRPVSDEKKARRKLKAKEKKARKAEEKAAQEEEEEASASEEEADTPDTSALPTATRKVNTIARPARRSQVATREERRGMTFVMATKVQRSNASHATSRGDVSWASMAVVSQGMARMRAVLVGATVRSKNRQRATGQRSDAAQEPWEIAMQEAAAVHTAMAAWRVKLDKVQATARLSATMTMAIVRKRMVWRMHVFWQAIAMQRCRNRSLMDCCLRQLRRSQNAPDKEQAASRLRAAMRSSLVRKALWQTTAKHKRGQPRRTAPSRPTQASGRITATMTMVLEMKRAQPAKSKRKAAYLRLAATYAMVEVRRVIKTLMLRKSQKKSQLQHDQKLRAAQDILPDRFTTSDLEAALRKNRQQEADKNSTT